MDENGNPLSGGVVSDLNSDKVATADGYDIATIVGVKVGMGSFKAVVPGHVPQTLPVRIVRSTTTNVYVKMQNMIR